MDYPNSSQTKGRSTLERKKRKRDDTPLPLTWLSFFQSQIFFMPHDFFTHVVTEGCVDVGCRLVEEHIWDCCTVFSLLKSFLQSLHKPSYSYLKLWGYFRWNLPDVCVCMSVCGNIWPICVCGRRRATPVNVSECAQSVWHILKHEWLACNLKQQGAWNNTSPLTV